MITAFETDARGIERVREGRKRALRAFKGVHKATFGDKRTCRARRQWATKMALESAERALKKPLCHECCDGGWVHGGALC